MGDGWRTKSVRLAWIVLIAAVGSLLFAEVSAAQAPCEAEEPAISHVVVTGVSSAGAAVEATISPHGKETAYEFLIVWQEASPPHGEPPSAGLAPQGGRIAPLSTDVTESAELRGLHAGYVYWLEVVASNAAGEARSEPQAFDYFSGGGFPYGTGSGPPYRPPELCWANESGNRAAEQTVKEQRAKEAAEQAARKSSSEESAARCHVPDLRGHTLRGARRALARAHCRLGHVAFARGPRSGLLVAAQSVRRGRTLAAGARISITLGRVHRARST